MWQKCRVSLEPAFLCSSSVKSEPTWLRPGELTFAAKWSSFCISIDGTNVQNLPIFAHFLCFEAKFAVHLGSSLRSKIHGGSSFFALEDFRGMFEESFPTCA